MAITIVYFVDLERGFKGFATIKMGGIKVEKALILYCLGVLKQKDSELDFWSVYILLYM